MALQSGVKQTKSKSLNLGQCPLRCKNHVTVSYTINSAILAFIYLLEVIDMEFSGKWVQDEP